MNLLHALQLQDFSRLKNLFYTEEDFEKWMKQYEVYNFFIM